VRWDKHEYDRGIGCGAVANDVYFPQTGGLFCCQIRQRLT
jgi:hypothetical protein